MLRLIKILFIPSSVLLMVSLFEFGFLPFGVLHIYNQLFKKDKLKKNLVYEQINLSKKNYRNKVTFETQYSDIYEFGVVLLDGSCKNVKFDGELLVTIYYKNKKMWSAEIKSYSRVYYNKGLNTISKVVFSQVNLIRNRQYDLEVKVLKPINSSIECFNDTKCYLKVSGVP